MKTIIITDPSFLYGEEKVIVSLFEAGIYRLHIRKPGAGKEDVARLVEKIPRQYRKCISLNDHFSLVGKYSLGGVHLNSRNPEAPEGFRVGGGIISRSCHSMEDVHLYKYECNYLFLSPIFDSISKRDYESHFSEDELLLAKEDGIVDDKVFALGGVFPERADYLRRMNFGGAVMLGFVWEAYKNGEDMLPIFHKIESLVKY